MPSKVYHFGIVGTGMIAEFHAKAIQAMDNAKLIAVFNRNLSKAEAFAGRFECEACDDLEQLLANNDLDVITVCTPSGAHLEPGIAAANAGKHVIMEKPLEVNLERADALIQACEQNNVQLISVLPRRFNASTNALKKAVEQGRFGRITMAEASIKWFRTQEYYDSGAWRGTWSLDGGGALMNQSIHTVDLLIHVMGKVKKVSAFAALAGHDGIEVEDALVAILEFENGAKGIIQASTTCYSKTGHPAQVQICGMEGSAFMVDDKFSVWDFKTPAAEDEEIRDKLGLQASSEAAGASDPKAIDFSWHQRNFEEALHAIDENRPSIVDGEQGRMAIELIGAIYSSAAQQGTPVSLPLQHWPDKHALTTVITGK